MPSSVPHPKAGPALAAEPRRQRAKPATSTADSRTSAGRRTPKPPGLVLPIGFNAGLTFDPRPPRMSPAPPHQALTTTHERTNTALASPGSRRRSGFEPRPPRVLQPARGACGAGTAGSTRTVTSDVDPNGNRYMWGTR